MTVPENGSELLSIPELAAYLGLGERTILMWAQQEKIPAFKVMSTWRFRRHEIDAWLESQRSGPDVASMGSSLTNQVNPPMSSRSQTLQNQKDQDAIVESCIDHINNMMKEETYRTVWVSELLEEQFGEEYVKVALKKLAREKKIVIREIKNVPGANGNKVKDFQRR